MSLRHADSDFSGALLNSGLTGWKDHKPIINLDSFIMNNQNLPTASPWKTTFRGSKNKWHYQMSPKQAEIKLNGILEGLEKHQSDFALQTRIDSVDVIVRRKDTTLEPASPPKHNVA